MAGCCQCTETRDWSALLKCVFVVILCHIMLICYGSAYGMCEEMNWDEFQEHDLDDFKRSDCRFTFYDRTFRFVGASVFTGHAYVVYYIFFWTCILITAILATLALCCKCCTFLRRFLSLGFLVLTVMLVISDVVSLGTSWQHYQETENHPYSMSQKGWEDRVIAYRNSYLGLNCAILVMQTYILLNTAYDLADTRDMKEESDEMPEQEMATQKHGVLA
jgi:hypothetical protein